MNWDKWTIAAVIAAITTGVLFQWGFKVDSLWVMFGAFVALLATGGCMIAAAYGIIFGKRSDTTPRG